MVFCAYILVHRVQIDLFWRFYCFVTFIKLNSKKAEQKLQGKTFKIINFKLCTLNYVPFGRNCPIVIYLSTLTVDLCYEFLGFVGSTNCVGASLQRPESYAEYIFRQRNNTAKSLIQ